MNWKKEFTNSVPQYEGKVHSKFLRAEQKADTVAERNNKYDITIRKTAIKIVNLYSQNEGIKEINIYEMVNEQLRNDSNANNMWTRYAGLLTSSIDILCAVQEVCEMTVYRGGERCDEITSKNQRYVTLRGFTSTSTEAGVAAGFMDGNGNKCKLFFNIKKARGLAIYLFSDYPKESEILLHYNSVFHITKRLDDENAIRNAMKALKVDKYPNTYFEMTFISSSVIGLATTVVTNLQILGCVTVVLAVIY